MPSSRAPDARCHQLTATNGQAQARSRLERPRGDQRAQLPERVPRERDRTHERLAPFPAGDARAEDRRLGEPGALAHPRKRVLADERDALRQQLRDDARDLVAEGAGLASLAREEARYGAGWTPPEDSPFAAASGAATAREPPTWGVRSVRMEGCSPELRVEAAGAQRCRPNRCARRTASARLRAPSLR